MKLLAWIFNGTSRHYRDIHLYEKGLKGRIIMLIVTLIMTGVTAGLEYWLYCSIVTGADFAVIFGATIVTIAFVFTLIDFSAVFAYVAFRNAFFGIVMTTAKLIEKRNRKRKNNGESSETIEQAVEEEYASVKTYKVFDIILSLVFLAIAVATIISVVYVPVTALKVL